MYKLAILSFDEDMTQSGAYQMDGYYIEGTQILENQLNIYRLTKNNASGSYEEAADDQMFFNNRSDKKVTSLTKSKIADDFQKEMCIRDRYKVLQARDYKLDTCKNMETGEVTPTGLPQSNVLYYDLEDGAWLCVRPSGTEPKIKLYYGVKGSSMEDAENRSAELGKYAEALLG